MSPMAKPGWTALLEVSYGAPLMIQRYCPTTPLGALLLASPFESLVGTGVDASRRLHTIRANFDTFQIVGTLPVLAVGKADQKAPGSEATK